MAHRSSSCEEPKSLTDLIDTIDLSLKKMESIALLIESSVTSGDKLNADLMSAILCEIGLQAADVRAWLGWWKLKDRALALGERPG